MRFAAIFSYRCCRTLCSLCSMVPFTSDSFEKSLSGLSTRSLNASPSNWLDFIFTDKMNLTTACVSICIVCQKSESQSFRHSPPKIFFVVYFYQNSIWRNIFNQVVQKEFNLKSKSSLPNISPSLVTFSLYTYIAVCSLINLEITY